MSDINWKDAPEWALSLGVAGGDKHKIWYDRQNYKFLNPPYQTRTFGVLGCFRYENVVHIMDRPKKELILGNISHNKYEREITDRQGNSATVDVYDVLKAFEVTCPATQHAVKKLLCSGLRGHKDLQTDLIEAKESIVRAIELN